MITKTTKLIKLIKNTHDFENLGKSLLEKRLKRLINTVQKDIDDQFVRGYSLLASFIADENGTDQSPYIKDAIKCHGLTLEDFEKSGIPEQDIKIIRKVFKD